MNLLKMGYKTSHGIRKGKNLTFVTDMLNHHLSAVDILFIGTSASAESYDVLRNKKQILRKTMLKVSKPINLYDRTKLLLTISHVLLGLHCSMLHHFVRKFFLFILNAK